jgi:hypothetical protein
LNQLAYKVKTLAKVTDISQSQLKKAIYSGELSACKNGVEWLILAEDAQAYLKSLPKPRTKKAREGEVVSKATTPAHAFGD